MKFAAVQIAHIIGAKVILCALDDEESSKIKRYLAESGGINEVTIIEKSGKADELNELKVDVLL
ncbi:hypothetical protein, partial [Salmonella sp. s51944]|uniref:hypothetical protein n=1 Tax=Salmonella sp. s51944 TaxID=3159655 RepID=UPI00397FCEA5